MITIRLARHGAKKKPFYQIVIADNRFSRNGRFIERLGFFNPIASIKEKTIIKIDTERVNYWIKNGANMTNRVRTLIKKLTKNNLNK
ncbi:30S ribosomal protein S16 [Candidatus Tachikawaea gelatinosa]|uniref:Small ribosomal subunit protein bS16 n=1 Tax=Candidatus Tachikawaea gelatinosa TaxID=1410383 RepID=A0A090BWI3_9ENTR|nr:30S ribosomal protein S16 [Candidatus Tachikawaea gelatinosa]BAP58656.1 30S ribosomal protein S16 [Candidatus Tachikawaea gelatinosa]